MQGLKINEDLTISYHLFADDLGIFLPATPEAFQQVRDALLTYENAFGSKLKLHTIQSAIYPHMAHSNWLHNQ